VAAFAVSLSAQVAVQPAAAAHEPDNRGLVVARTAAAINYRLLSGDVKVDLLGTPLLPNGKGQATVSGEKGYLVIDVRLHGMEAATKFGGEYLTYVLWAVTPEGHARNLGEVQIDGDDARMEVTTELQALALVVTAEPYYAVTQPSEMVVIENASRAGSKGSVETIPATYTSVKRGAYVASESGFREQRLESGVPLELAQARNAVELARIAGADGYAADTYEKARRLLVDAEAALEQRQPVHQVMMPARQAVQTAEVARLSALRRRDEARVEQEARAATAATSSERASSEVRQPKQDGSADAERAEVAQRAAEAELQQVRLQALKAQATAAIAEQEKNAIRERLREQLNAILETRETARGLIMNVPDVLFRTASATLTAVAREKLARVGGILAAQPELHIAVEGHTDDVGNDQDNQQLSEKRAHAVLAYLVQQNIPLTAVDTAGFGETRPVASNDTEEGRRQNRRVDVVVTGEAIGRFDAAGNPAP
jgi:outer membrane protein OmpA-like peptidoglycan-associated protein